MMGTHPDELVALASDAVDRLVRRLETRTPTLASATEAWMRSLGVERDAQRYFLHPRAFPMLLLPWWLEEHIAGAPSPAFQSVVVYSTISGYYFVRMVDDLMDGVLLPATSILPAMGVFHTEFEQAYHPIFPSRSRFWKALVAATSESAENAARDHELDKIDIDLFVQVSARKVAGAKVPLAAVCYRHGRPELLAPWSALVDGLGRWHQMLNDIVDWSRDQAQGRSTLLLSEAARRSPAAPTEWLLEEGLGWGYGLVRQWLQASLDSAGDLGSLPLARYLESRLQGVETEWRELDANLRGVEGLRTLGS